MAPAYYTLCIFNRRIKPSGDNSSKIPAKLLRAIGPINAAEPDECIRFMYGNFYYAGHEIKLGGLGHDLAASSHDCLVQEDARVSEAVFPRGAWELWLTGKTNSPATQSRQGLMTSSSG
jgi:hypothetical protein